MSESEPIGMLGAVDLLFSIARKHGFADYAPVLSKIIGKDYQTVPFYQWEDRARRSGYLMYDDIPFIDSIDLFFAQERIVRDKGVNNYRQIQILNLINGVP